MRLDQCRQGEEARGVAASQTRHDSPYSTVVAPLDLALLADISDVVAVQAFVRSDARIVDERVANSRFFFQVGGLQFYLRNGIRRFDDFFVLQSPCVSLRSSYHVHVIVDRVFLISVIVLHRRIIISLYIGTGIT